MWFVIIGIRKVRRSHRTGSFESPNHQNHLLGPPVDFDDHPSARVYTKVASGRSAERRTRCSFRCDGNDPCPAASAEEVDERLIQIRGGEKSLTVMTSFLLDYSCAGMNAWDFAQSLIADERPRSLQPGCCRERHLIETYCWFASTGPSLVEISPHDSRLLISLGFLSGLPLTVLKAPDFFLPFGFLPLNYPPTFSPLSPIQYVPARLQDLHRHLRRRRWWPLPCHWPPPSPTPGRSHLRVRARLR